MVRNETLKDFTYSLHFKHWKIMVGILSHFFYLFIILKNENKNP